ncbi:MAG: phenylacetic acid degradation operon negative regulatory protein PaaX, partial [Marinobacter sp.]
KQLCRNLYRQIYVRAEQWLDETLENASGPLPGPGEKFYRRFGGLRDVASKTDFTTERETS